MFKPKRPQDAYLKKENGTFHLQITVDRGRRYSGKQLQSPLRTRDPVEARCKRNASIKQLFMAGRLSDSVARRAIRFGCLQLDD